MRLTNQAAHLSEMQRERFLHDGFVRIHHAFPADVAAEGRAILWRDTSCNPNDRSTWTRPVVRLGDYAQEPFRIAVNTPALHAAFDDLAGRDRWVARQSLGGFPVRFPHPDDPGDTGWHVDASFPPKGAANSYFEWRVNVRSRRRALLMLFLFSDVGEDDAPTRIRVGSHLVVARLLAPAGDAGMSMIEISQAGEAATGGLPEASATGPAGTVYLCHPFLLHAAQAHRGTVPRFMAQPPLVLKTPYALRRSDWEYSLVERAIRMGLGIDQD